MRWGRLVSLDVMRGATIAGMLLVNNPGSWTQVYPALRHAEWHGWTATDLIFPFFLFIMGAAMAFSLPRQRARGEAEIGATKGSGRRAIIKRTCRRVLLLIGLGLLLNGFPAFEYERFRIPGVLQRIGLVYALAVPVVLLLRPAKRFVLGVVVLLAWWAVLVLVPVGGEAPAMDPTRNLQRSLDLSVFGEFHVWQGGPTDPEGLLGTFAAMVTCLLGYWAGVFVRDRELNAKTAARLGLAGLLIAAVGEVWAYWLPINKPLWSPSYVMLSGGLAMSCFAVCLWFVDIRGYRWITKPLRDIGLNAIVIFVGAGMMSRLLARTRVGGWPEAPDWTTFAFDEMVEFGVGPRFASLVLALVFVFVWWVIAALLAQWRIVVRV